MTTLQWPNGPKCLMMQHRKTVAQQWRGDDGGGDAICRNFPLAPLIICRPLHKADKFHTKSYLAKHDLTFAHKVAQSTKWRFLPKNLSQLVIFVIGLAFT